MRKYVLPIAVGTALLVFQNCGDPVNPTFNTSNSSRSTSLAQKSQDDYIANVYQGLLNRPPTSLETQSWDDLISQGYGCSYIAKTVAGTAEYSALVASHSIATNMGRMYVALANRAPVADDLTLATTALNSGQSMANLIANFLRTAEFAANCYDYSNLKP